MILLQTFVAISLLVGLFDGINREVERRVDAETRDDLIRRGYIL